MSFLKKVFKGAVGFFFGGELGAWLGAFGSDLLGSLFKVDIPRPPASLGNGGKTYQVDLRNNVSRLGEPMPVGYGRWRDWYDYRSSPYVEYRDNKQVLFAWLTVTVGRAQVESLFIGDTPFSSFAGSRVEVLPPGTPNTLTHPDVVTSEDVTNIEVQAGILGQITITREMDFAPVDGPQAGSDRIRTWDSGVLDSIDNGATILVGGSTSNDGSYTVIGRGAGYDYFTKRKFSYVRVSATLTVETATATITHEQETTDAKTIRVEDIPLTFNAAQQSITGPEDALLEFQIGDSIIISGSDDNDDIPYEIISSNGTVLVVDPPPVDEVISDPVATVTLRRRRIGPFPFGRPGAKASRIGFDVSFAGLGVPDGADIDPVTVVLQVEAGELDDFGNPVGPFVAHEFSYTGDEFENLTFSDFIELDYPMYGAVYFTRFTIASDKNQRRDTMTIAGLRAYMDPLPGTTPEIDADCTTIAVQITASGRLSREQQRSINGINQRLLPVWDGETWSEPQATRNPAWAFADWLIQQSRGQITAANLDLPRLLELAELWGEREDTFDALFDREVMLWEGAQSILRVGRARPLLDPQTRLISIYRDEPAAPKLLLADGINCDLGALRIDTPTADTPTGVRVKPIDPTTWQERGDGPLAGSDDDPREVSFFGCTSWDRAWEEAAYEYADLRYRVISTTADADKEGLHVRLGDRLLVGSSRCGWGQVAEVTGQAGLVLALWPAPAWTEGVQHYLHLQGPDGVPGARINCGRGSSDEEAVLESAPDVTLRLGSGFRTLALLGHDAGEGIPARGPQVCILEGGSSNGLRGASLELRVEYLGVHDDPGPAPEDPYPIIGDVYPLTIELLTASIDAGNVDAHCIVVSGAVYYEWEWDDGSDVWRLGARSTGANAWFGTDGGDVTVRCRAIGYGGRIGQWSDPVAATPI